MENKKKKSLREYIKDADLKKDKKKSDFSIVYSREEEPKYEGFTAPRLAKSEKSKKKISSLKESLIKKEKELFEKKYEFEIKEIADLVYEKKPVIFNFVASYFLFLDLPSISKVTKEMPYGEPFPVEWFQGESIIGEPLTGDEKYEFFIGRNGRTFMYLKGIGNKFEKIAGVLRYIIEQKNKGIEIIEKYGKDIIVFANSMKKDSNLELQECLPDEILEEDRIIYEELFFRILEKKKVEIEEEKQEVGEEIIQGITFKPLLKKSYIGNPFGVLYSSFPETKEIYDQYGDKIHTFINDLSQILLHYDLCFDAITWKEIEDKFTNLKSKVIPQVLKSVKSKYKEEYERFVIKAQRLKSFIRKNLKEKEKRLIDIIDFIIAVYIIRRWYEANRK